MSLAPQGGSDNTNSAPASRASDSVSTRASENFLNDVGSSYLSDAKNLTSSPGFGGPNDKTDPQASLDAGMQNSPYATMFANPAGKSDATLGTSGTVDTSTDSTDPKSTDRGADRLATIGDKGTSEVAEPTKQSFDPGERRTLAQSGGGGC